MPSLASRLSRVEPSATIAIANKARTLKAKGIDVLSFSVGEPDFATPTHICEAAKRAIDEGATRYTAAHGTPELRAAIATRSFERRGVKSKPTDVVVSVGAKHTLYNIATALFEEGDEVIIPSPHWVSYPAQVLLAGAQPVHIMTSEANGFRLSPDQLRGALTENTKGVILCTPSNPTGSAYSEEQLKALAEVLKASDCWIIVDEIYGELVYGDFEQKSLLTVAPELRDRIIVVDGVSKTYAMTGWRIGWMIAPEPVAKACAKIQSQSTTNPTSCAQAAALAAVAGPSNAVSAMRAAFEKRRSIIIDGLNKIDGISATMPDGAFYAFANVSELVGRSFEGRTLASDLELCDFLLDEARCAFVPGTAFGAPGYLRISYAASEAQIAEGLRRVREAVSRLT